MMKKVCNKRALIIIIAGLIGLLLAFKVYYELAKYNHRWWFNYLDQSDFYEIEISRLEEDSSGPKEIIEYILEDGKTAYIYIYEDWYDVAYYYAEDGTKSFDYRVLTNDKFKLGPREIDVGTSRLKVSFFFAGTRHSKDPIDILFVNEEGVVETLKCRGFMNTSPVDNSKIGFVFSKGNVVAMVFSPSEI